MNTTKINITFLLARSRLNQSGKCSLRCRITFLQKRHEFATGMFINPNHWYSKFQLAKPPDEENKIINNQLSLIKNRINQAFLFLQMKGTAFDVDDIYKIYKGEKPRREKGVLEAFHEYNEKIKKLIDIEIEQVTYNKYVESYNHLRDFIKFHFKSNDIKIKDLKGNFLEEFDYYLKTQKGKNGLAQSTINKAIQRFRKTLKYAMSEGYLESNPFLLHVSKPVKKNVIFLLHEELKRLESHQFKTDRVQAIKEMFVFCCYTGLAFREMSSLKKSDIFKGFDNQLWIKVVRKKTDKDYRVPLLPTPLRIIQKYDDDNTCLIFPKISNQKFNEYLKEIAEILEIQKNLTHHVARKTFASTILLYNDVPMEIVSELLGHSKISTTQEHYGKIVQKRVSEHITVLAEKLK